MKALLKPLSCSAIAAASDGGTPCSDAVCWTSKGVTLSCVGCGVASGACVGEGDGGAAMLAAAGSLSAVPASSVPSSSSPFIQAT